MTHVGEGRTGREPGAVIFRNAGTQTRVMSGCPFSFWGSVFSQPPEFLPLAGPLMGLCADLRSPGWRKAAGKAGPLGGGRRPLQSCCVIALPAAAAGRGRARSRSRSPAWGQGTAVPEARSPRAACVCWVVEKTEAGGHVRCSDRGSGSRLLRPREGGEGWSSRT